MSPESSIFVGPKVAAERIERRTDDRIVGVSLAAGAEFAFTGHGGDTTRGITAPLDALVSVGSLPERLAEAEGGEVLECLETELVGLLKYSPVNPQVLAAARAIRSGHRATRALEVLGVDRRTFAPEFRRAVGAAPKHYERICRFNLAVDAIRRHDPEPLATIAAQHGFADQAHLTREIRHFAQTSPSRLHGDGTTMINHLDPDKIFKT